MKLGALPRAVPNGYTFAHIVTFPVIGQRTLPAAHIDLFSMSAFDYWRAAMDYIHAKLGIRA